MKDLVTYFYQEFGIEYDAKSFKICIAQIKTLMNKKNYSIEQIKETIDYVSRHKPANGVYSFGYIITVIDDVQNILSEIENQPIATIPIKEIKTTGNKSKVTTVKTRYDESLFR